MQNHLRSLFGAILLSSTALLLCLAVLYGNNIGLVWDTEAQQEKWDSMVRDYKDQVSAVIKEHDALHKAMLELERENKQAREKKLQEELKEKQRQENEQHEREEQEAEAEKTEEQRQKEASQKAEEEARDKRHEELEKLHNDMIDKNETHLLREIDLGLNATMEPSGHKVVVVSGCDKNCIKKNETRFQEAQNNRQEYTKYHGYVYNFIDTTEFQVGDDFPGWNKIGALKRAFDNNPQAEWFWWIDMDLIITNELTSLAKHVLHPEVLKERITWGRPIRDETYAFVRLTPQKSDTDINNIELLITQDAMGWNTGSMFLRNTQYMRSLLNIWELPVMRDHDWKQAEQSAFTNLAVHNEELFLKVATIPQRICNSYYDEQQKYQPGDLVLHFAGVVKKLEEYGRIWSRMYESRIRVPDEYWLS